MSGKINVGFMDGRISSRVLKPPGGGYSEIFFEDAPKPAPKTLPPRVQTSVESILSNEPANEEPDAPKMDELMIAAEEPEKIVEEKKAEAAPKRLRVPPGGFSSGLW